MNQNVLVETERVEITSEFKCEQCGAKLSYKVGTNSLACSYCSHENHIPQQIEDIIELDFNAYLADNFKDTELQERIVVPCTTCGAESTVSGKVVAHKCSFCDSPLVTQSKSVRLIKPKSLLPFKISKQQAQQSYNKWLSSLWFAPNALKARARAEKSMNGIYLPHWTYDASTLSYYNGMRGIHYYVTETQSFTDSNGKTGTKNIRVQKTRWYPVSGTVLYDFNDVLVNASNSLPRQYIQSLEPWDLSALQPYQDEFLSGFHAESYQVNLQAGFEQAKVRMHEVIQQAICQQIGGDEQRILSVRTSHNQVTFKHILLPVWVSAYRYHEKIYRFMVNARTGEVQGERPWSWIKITLAVLVLLVILFAVFKVSNTEFSNY